MNKAALPLLLLPFLPLSPSEAAEWKGVDEAVVEKVAREHGREPKNSLFDAAEGDLQLFLFLAAGAAGGFAAGYSWRVLSEGGQKGERGNETRQATEKTKVAQK